jgi:hypothetical protein
MAHELQVHLDGLQIITKWWRHAFQVIGLTLCLLLPSSVSAQNQGSEVVYYIKVNPLLDFKEVYYNILIRKSLGDEVFYTYYFDEWRIPIPSCCGPFVEKDTVVNNKKITFFESTMGYDSLKAVIEGLESFGLEENGQFNFKESSKLLLFSKIQLYRVEATKVDGELCACPRVEKWKVGTDKMVYRIRKVKAVHKLQKEEIKWMKEFLKKEVLPLNDSLIWH